MKIKTALYLAVKYLTTREKQGKKSRNIVSAVVGVFLSLIPLVVVLEVANGMIEGITRRYIEVGTYHLQIKSYDNVIEEQAEQLINRLEKESFITRVFPFVQGLGIIYSEQANTGVSVRGLPADFYSNDPAVRDYLTVSSGSFDLETGTSVLLSENVAHNLGVEVGDSVKLLTAKTIPGRPMILRPSTFTVKAVFTTGYHELDALSVYIPLEKAKILFPESGAYSVGVKVSDPYNRLERNAEVVQRLAKGGWYVYTWYQLEKSMYRSFETTKSLLMFIMALIVCVASVNISSTLVMLVMERQSEIAILKCSGASPGQITLSFIFTGFFVGIIGTFFGICGGLLISLHINEIIHSLEYFLMNILRFAQVLFQPFVDVPVSEVEILNPTYYLEEIPVSINLAELSAVAILAVLLATLASYFPARKAGKIRPLEILRKH